MNSYKDLIVWQKSLKLAKEIYRVTELFPKFLSIAFGSTSEIEAQLILAHELEFIGKDFTVIVDLLIEVRKMLNSMIKRSKS